MPSKIKAHYDTQSRSLNYRFRYCWSYVGPQVRSKDKVTVIAKSKIIDNNTNYAQGGIASVLSPDDSYEKHIEDTMEAGADLCHRDIVSLVVRGGPKAIEELIQLGVDFTRDANADGKGYHLTREGGHQERRVIHAHDLTGKSS